MRAAAAVAGVAAVATAVAVGVYVTRDGTPAAAPSPAATSGPPSAPATPPASPSPSVSPAAVAPPGVPETFVGIRDDRVVLFSTRTGQPLRYLTKRSSYGDRLPLFTADRSRIRFVHQTTDCSAELREVRPDGRGERVVVPARGEGEFPSPGVETVRGTVSVGYECAEGYGTLMLRAPDGTGSRLAFANSMSMPAVSGDGRYVYVAMSGADSPGSAEAFRAREIRRIDVTRRTRDLVARARTGCQWEGGVTSYVSGGRRSVVAVQRCGEGAAGRSSLMVLDERLAGPRTLAALGADHVMSVGVDPSGRHLLLYRSNWRDDDVPDTVQRWSGGRLATIAYDVRDPDW